MHRYDQFQMPNCASNATKNNEREEVEAEYLTIDFCVCVSSTNKKVTNIFSFEERTLFEMNECRRKNIEQCGGGKGAER